MTACLLFASRIRAVFSWLMAGGLGSLILASGWAQTYAPPALGDFGGWGSSSVFVDTFANPVYPTANGQALVVSVFHPGSAINPSLPTVFFAHGYTSPIGNAQNYLNVLNNLASWGYNVVFSPYEGGLSPNIGQRFDELTTGFEAAVTNYGLNTAQVGFAGHSYGGGFLPAVVLHEMMGKGDFYGPGHTWGGTAAFFYSMAPGYAFGGGAQTDVSATQTIYFPTNLYVIEQAFNDDTVFADPRLAIDIFYNITTPNSQKEFFTVYGDNHGSPAEVADHFLPNAYGEAVTNLQAWAILRRLDALAAYTFTGDLAARQIALGNGAAAETYQGTWSDGVSFAPMGVTDIPSPAAYYPGPYTVQWNYSNSNPRFKYPLVSGPPVIRTVAVSGGKALVTVDGLLSGHSYVQQASPDLASGSWTNGAAFVYAPSGAQTNPSMTFTNSLSNSTRLFWRILAP